MKIPLNAERQCDAAQHARTRDFRRLLNAFGYPFRLQQLAGDAVEAVIGCLLDSGTTAAVSADCGDHLDRILATGAQLGPDPQWVFTGPSLKDLSDIPTGSRSCPQAGATVVLSVQGISDKGGPLAIRATGASLATAQTLYFTGLPLGVVKDHIALHDDYPRGVDLLVCAGTRVVALPRHLKLEIV